MTDALSDVFSRCADRATAAGEHGRASAFRTAASAAQGVEKLAADDRAAETTGYAAIAQMLDQVAAGAVDAGTTNVSAFEQGRARGLRKAAAMARMISDDSPIAATRQEGRK